MTVRPVGSIEARSPAAWLLGLARSMGLVIPRLTVGEPTAGTNLELEAISIVVIGGTSLFGGEGGVGGTVIGAAIIALMANILNLLGISPFTQQIVKGAIILPRSASKSSAIAEADSNPCSATLRRRGEGTGQGNLEEWRT